MKKLLRDQEQVSLQHPMPVDDTSVSSSIYAPGAATVQLQFFSTGTLTNDAGQAAGVVVLGQLANKNILSELGDRIGSFNDTSLAFTSTALTNEVKIDFLALETADFNTLENKLAAVTKNFSNGDWAMDYRTGTFYAKKASTQSTLTTTTYKINLGQVGATAGGGSTAANQTAIQNAAGDGNSVSGDTAHDAPDAGEPIKIGGKAAVATSLPTAVSNAGDRVDAAFSFEGEQFFYKSRYDSGEGPGRGTEGRVLMEQGNGYTNITTNATTTVVTGAGNFARIIVNVAGATSQVVIYDNTAGSGTIIATLTTLAQGSFEFGVDVGTGLTLVTTGGTPANITVVSHDHA